MGFRMYPPLTTGEIQEVLRARGFRIRNTNSSHQQWGISATNYTPAYLVTVDTNYAQPCEKLLKTMIRQSGLSREQFYGSAKGSARKASVPFLLK